jgi:type IV pilus biogenesis protein CpaD/CtpE
MAGSQLSRRTFARVVSAALAGTAAGAALPLTTAAPPPPQATAAGGGVPAEVEAQWARVLAIYGERLTAAQKQRLRGIIAGHVAMLQPVRAVAMRNSDPPQTVLRLTGAKR